MMVTLSILDQAPASSDGAPGEALRNTIELARFIDDLGFRRLWIAEHHGLASVTSAAPEVVIGPVAAATRHLRVGSGAILLPNHRPLHVAEQFCALEALFPGRIDLGIGRSDGGFDDATIAALGRPDDVAHGTGFDDLLDELLAFGGVLPLPDDHPLATVRASPADVPLPPVTLLGSSVSSAATAARRGLPYAFAATTSPDAVADALRGYRNDFVASRSGDRPYAILGLNIVAGEDDEHAAALALPSRLVMAQSRLGLRARMLSVEDALAHRWTEAEREAYARHVDDRAAIVGGPAAVAAGVERAVEASGADEVIVYCNTSDPAERRAVFGRLARTVGIAPAAAAQPAYLTPRSAPKPSRAPQR